MTLDQSSKNPFSVLNYSLYLVRRHAWMFVVFGLPGIFCGPLFFGFTLRLKVSEAMLNPEMHTNLVQSLLALYRNTGMIPLYLWAIAFGFVLAMVMGAYLHSRKQVDFYHALPVQRNQYFYAQIIASFLIFFILTVLLLVFIVVVSMIFLAALPISTIVYWLFIHLLQMSLIFAASYLLTALAGQLTGTIFSHGAMAVVLQVGLFLWTAFTILMLDSKLITYPGVHNATILGRLFNHSSLFTTATTYGYGWDIFRMGELKTPFLSTTSYVILAVVIVLGFFLTQFLYGKRPLERAGQTIIYNVEKFVLKAYFIYIATFVGAMLIEMMLGMKSIIAALIAGFVMAAFAHVVMEMVFNRDVRSYTRGIVSSLIIFVAVSGLYIAIDKDVMHYDEYLPQKDQVSWMNWSFDNNREVKLEDPELIAAALDINKKLIENANVDGSYADENKPFVGIPTVDENNNVTWLSNTYWMTSEYHLKKGLPKVRYNNGSLPEGAGESFKKLYESETFKEALYKDIFAEKPKFAEFSLDVNDEGPLAPKDQGLATYHMISEMVEVKSGEKELKDAKALTDALQKDLKNRSYEDLLQNPVYNLYCISLEDTENHGEGQNVAIYETDENAMKIINKWVSEGKILSHEKALAQSHWMKHLYRAHIDDSGKKLVIDEQVTDPEEIKSLLHISQPEYKLNDNKYLEFETKKVLVYNAPSEEGFAAKELRFFIKNQQA